MLGSIHLAVVKAEPIRGRGGGGGGVTLLLRLHVCKVVVTLAFGVCFKMRMRGNLGCCRILKGDNLGSTVVGDVRGVTQDLICGKITWGSSLLSRAARAVVCVENVVERRRQARERDGTCCPAGSTEADEGPWGNLRVGLDLALLSLQIDTGRRHDVPLSPFYIHIYKQSLFP